MTYVQIDLYTYGTEPGDGESVWSGVMQHLPNAGDTLDIRGPKSDVVSEGRVESRHWTLVANEPSYASVIINVREGLE